MAQVSEPTNSTDHKSPLLDQESLLLDKKFVQSNFLTPESQELQRIASNNWWNEFIGNVDGIAFEDFVIKFKHYISTYNVVFLANTPDMNTPFVNQDEEHDNIAVLCFFLLGFRQQNPNEAVIEKKVFNKMMITFGNSVVARLVNKVDAILVNNNENRIKNAFQNFIFNFFSGSKLGSWFYYYPKNRTDCHIRCSRHKYAIRLTGSDHDDETKFQQFFILGSASEVFNFFGGFVYTKEGVYKTILDHTKVKGRENSDQYVDWVCNIFIDQFKPPTNQCKTSTNKRKNPDE